MPVFDRQQRHPWRICPLLQAERYLEGCTMNRWYKAGLVAWAMAWGGIQPLAAQEIPDNAETDMKVGGSVRAIMGMAGVETEKVNTCTFRATFPDGIYELDFTQLDNIVPSKGLTETLPLEIIFAGHSGFVCPHPKGSAFSCRNQFSFPGISNNDYVRMYMLTADIVSVCNPKAAYKPCPSLRHDKNMVCVR